MQRPPSTGMIIALGWSLCAASGMAELPQPRKVIAMIDGTQNFGTTRRSISFYDVTELGGVAGPAGGDAFNQSPLFSAFVGFEDAPQTNNWEELETIAVNPANGTAYVIGFDSGEPGGIDAGGDGTGDLDIYRIDYQELLQDFLLNDRPRGTMYGPSVGPNGEASPQHLDHVGTTVSLPDAIVKVGEVARTQGTDFFDRDVGYVDPQTLILLDNEAADDEQASSDHELRVLERVGPDAGASTYQAATQEGGFNNQASQSWQADFAGQLHMDFGLDGTPVGLSEPEDMVLVERDGIVGVWVAESDGGGDDVSFFQLENIGDPSEDATAAKSTLNGLGTSRALDEDPEFDVGTNDGDHDYIKIDRQGNLVIGESGFFDEVPGGEGGVGGSPSGEPTVLRLNVRQYESGNVDLVPFDAWDDLDGEDGLGPVGADRENDALDGPVEIEGPLGGLVNAFDPAGADSPAAGLGLSRDDDTSVIDGRFATLDRGDNVLYLFDIDSGGVPNVVSDVYAIDLDTGEIIYEELNAVNHFLVEHGIRFFVRGDADGDGDVDGDDIDRFAAAAAGTPLEGEEFDLTGDDQAVFEFHASGSASDSDELIRGILGTEYGDANLDGIVSHEDLELLGQSFGSAAGWSGGDFNGTGDVSIADLDILGQMFGFDNAKVAGGSSSGARVPEPTSLFVALSSALVAALWSCRQELARAAGGMALVLAAGTSATAALTVEVAENPTANAPGFSQFVFTLISDMGDITSIDARFTGPPGSFRQFNPTSPPTIFADYNDLFPITEVPADDTHFEFDTEAHSLLTINTAESDQLLRAAFTREGGGPLDAESPTSVRFAHVVLQAGATGSFSINAVAGGAEFLDVLTSSGENTFGGNVGLLAGDYNDNGRVEQADLDLVLLNWGDSFAGLPPEWMNQRPGMGIVDQAELDGVLLNWGNGAAGLGGATAVPEPATLLSAGLLFAGAVALGPWRRTEASLRGCQRP